MQKGAQEFGKGDAFEILEFVGENPFVVAHNFPFDRKILQDAFQNVGVWLPKWSNWTCTQNLARGLQRPENLIDLAAYLEIPYHDKHTANGDC